MTVGRGLAFGKLFPVATGWITLAALAVYVPATEAQTPHAAPAVAAVAATTHPRGDIAGDWQGTLEVGHSVRVVVKIAKADKGWTANLYSIDQAAPPLVASSTVLDGSPLT